MIGLRNKMVLCERGEHTRALDRTIIIPFGEISVSKHETHMAVTISNENKAVDYLRFQIDPILGRLRGDGSIRSRLYQAYIHALTSGILPDPHTGRTGTEEALLILRSQIKEVSVPLQGETVNMLELLLALTPHRSFYPAHLQVMQQVKWSQELSFLSQHDDFAPLCAELLAAGNRFNIFYPENKGALSIGSRGSPHLLQRAFLRNSAFRSGQYGSNKDCVLQDNTYSSRDRSSITSRHDRTYQIAALVAQWPSKLPVSKNLASDFKSWGTVSGFGKTFATSCSIVDLLQISFSSSWASLRNLCCRSKAHQDKYKLLFTFAVIAYGRNMGPLEDLTTLLAFAFLQELQDIRVPSGHNSYQLSSGSSPSRDLMVNDI